MNTALIKYLVCEHFYLHNIRTSIELHQQCLFNTELNSDDLFLLISLVLIRTPSGRNDFAVFKRH